MEDQTSDRIWKLMPKNGFKPSLRDQTLLLGDCWHPWIGSRGEHGVGWAPRGLFVTNSSFITHPWGWLSFPCSTKGESQALSATVLPFKAFDNL
jgi:hypothetical protein